MPKIRLAYLVDGDLESCWTDVNIVSQKKGIGEKRTPESSRSVPTSSNTHRVSVLQSTTVVYTTSEVY